MSRPQIIIPEWEYIQLNNKANALANYYYNKELFIEYHYATGSFLYYSKDAAIEKLKKRIDELENLPWWMRLFKNYPWEFKI